MRPKKTIITKDYCKYVFKNGSYFDVVAASEKSRGKRRHGGVMEECVGIDGEILNEVILPRLWGLVAWAIKKTAWTRDKGVSFLRANGRNIISYTVLSLTKVKKV